MKAVILAAGKSERLSGFRGGIPKVMLPVHGKPILEHNLQYLKRAGIRDVIINLHYRPEIIRSFLKRHQNFGMKIFFSIEPSLLGTAGAIKKVESKLREAPFLVMYGDNLTDFQISKLTEAHKKRRAMITLGVYNPIETRWSGVAAGLIQIDRHGKVLRFVEKKNNQVIRSTSWVNAGMMIVSPKVFRLIPRKSVFDFAKDLFPLILKQKMRLQAVSGASYVLASDTVEAWKTTVKLAQTMIPKKG